MAAARRSTGPGQRSSSGSTFPSSPSAALPRLRGFPPYPALISIGLRIPGRVWCASCDVPGVADASRRSPFVLEYRVSLAVTHLDLGIAARDRTNPTVESQGFQTLTSNTSTTALVTW